MSILSKTLDTAKHIKQKPTYNLGQNIVYMISLAWKQRRSVILFALTMTVVAILLSLTQLFIVPSILGIVEINASVAELTTIILLFTGALILLSAARSYLSSCSQFGRIEVRLIIGSMIQNKALTMSYPDIEDQNVRKKMDKASMLVTSNTAATEAVWTTLMNLLQNVVEFFVYLSLLTTFNPLMIAAVLVTTVVSFSVSNYLGGWGYRHRDEESEYSRRMNYLSEKSRDYTLAKDVRIFEMRDWIEDVYNSTLRLYRSFVARGERVYIWGNIIDVILAFIRNGIVYLFLIGSVLKGDMSAAQFVLYFNTVNAFTNGIGKIMTDFATLRKQSLDICAVREFLDYPETFKMEQGIPITPDLNIPYQIELQDVSFRYPEAEKNTLSHINLTIRQGEKLAIVGLNGAGKTTLIKLICGFLDPTEGKVLLNDTDIRMYNRRDYYRLFSAVFQDFSVLDVTIAENIAQTDENINKSLMEQCINQAGLTEKIKQLPNGVETHIGKVFEDGIHLSGGELQRLMLARALYKNAPIIVLDEPTSALDPIAESEIYNKYNELTDGRMAVYISHRLASTRFCDRIILIADGSIDEEGTHDELITQNGHYANLFEIQSRYYREGGVSNEKA
ncbi:MAG: ABC transporter ATP-binding protein/permease [Lachnospiraceae bacterium]|nr:ABC transporter ATP-binding protein/permease [Lachnospiraceae bacterium]